MKIVTSQSKLLQRAGLWMWHTSCGSATPAQIHWNDDLSFGPIVAR